MACPVLAGDIEARSDDEPVGTGQAAETAKRQRPFSNRPGHDLMQKGVRQAFARLTPKHQK